MVGAAVWPGKLYFISGYALAKVTDPTNLACCKQHIRLTVKDQKFLVGDFGVSTDCSFARSLSFSNESGLDLGLVVVRTREFEG